MKFSEVKSFCEEKGYTSRASRYEIMENYFGVSAGTIKDIISFDRYLRDILEVDEIGLEKESEYHKPLLQVIYEQQQKKLLNQKLI